MNALVFLYKRVLQVPLSGSINAVRAQRKASAPVVLTREEARAVIALLSGERQLIVQMLYGSGLRVLEAVRLRVKDLDFQMKQVNVRCGKGDKNRFTTLSAKMVPLQNGSSVGCRASMRGHLVDADRFPLTARSVRKASIFCSPPSRSSRLCIL
jgi:integrase